MKHRKIAPLAATLAVCLALSTAAPAFAEDITISSGSEPTSFVGGLLDVPIIGDFLRLFMMEDQQNAALTGETATPETATPETATPETAPAGTAPTPTASAPPQTAGPTPTEEPSAGQGTVQPENGAATATPPAATLPPAAAQQWPSAWMQGAAMPGQAYPQGQAGAAAPTAANTLWGSFALSDFSTLRAVAREETNLGDLTADAVAMAVASGDFYKNQTAINTLPIVAAVDGNSFTGSVEAGTVLDATAAAAALADQNVAVVTVTPAKLHQILNAALVDMLKSTSSRFGNFLQISGLRMVYETTGGDPQVKSAWLADATNPEGKALDFSDDKTQIVLALPASLLDFYGVNAASGYTDYAASAALTLRGALAALPQNCDAGTLAALLARGGNSGRILPATAAGYTGVVFTDTQYANQVLNCLLDGKPITAVTDSTGTLQLPNLAPGAHTLQMKAGEPSYFISNITHIGTMDGMAVTLLSVPQDCVVGPAPSSAPTAAPSAAPSAAPTAAPSAAPAPAPAANAEVGHGDIGPAIANGTWGQDGGAPTAAPAPAAPAAAATPKPTAANNGGNGAAKATAAPVKDPTEGTLLDKTPAPTLEPTPTPTPTATVTPTLSPEEETTRKTSSNLPLYIGCGLLGLCAVIVGGVVIKRKMDQDKEERAYRKKK